MVAVREQCGQLMVSGAEPGVWNTETALLGICLVLSIKPEWFVTSLVSHTAQGKEDEAIGY